MNNVYILIITMSLVTICLRFLPFVLFSKHTPKAILYLGDVLPYAMMAMLVVYCLKDTNFLGNTHGIPEVIAVLSVIILHKWKHNTLLSILISTIIYMVLIQFIFI